VLGGAATDCDAALLRYHSVWNENQVTDHGAGRTSAVQADLPCPAELDDNKSGNLPQPLVSVIVPCFNHAHYLQDAISSILAQSYSNFEIVVVDDGSTDQTRQVASLYEKVRYVYQENRGLAAARNTGTRESVGPLLVYLDADDVLTPHALQIGVSDLLSHPECAFVSGDHRRVGPDLKPLFKFRARPVQRDHYLAFLRGNYIGMNATVMYRRKIVQKVGGFDESLAACEDYDLYLRIARDHPVRCHEDIVADYRQHGTNMSRNAEFMLKWILKVHQAEYPHVKGDPNRERAYAEGERYVREYYGDQILRHLRARFHISPADLGSIRSLALVAWNYPFMKVSLIGAKEKLGYVLSTVRHSLRKSTVWPPVGKVRFGALRITRPVCENNSGLPSIVDWYSERWIDRHQKNLGGRVLNLSIPGPGVDALVGLDSESYDSVVCTLQLQRVYEIDLAIREIGRVMRPSGLLLATLPGVTTAQSRPNEDDFWRLTTLSARRLFETQFQQRSIEVEAMGNVLAAVAALHGMAASDFSEQELETSSSQHPVVIAVRATKL
jgi:glycosyltransferase involved in cell wall biosynthesis